MINIMIKLIWKALCCFGNAYALVSAMGVPHSLHKNYIVIAVGIVIWHFLYPDEYKNKLT